MPHPIITFLRARLDEDGEAAREAALTEGLSGSLVDFLKHEAAQVDVAPSEAHYARHTPARVLRRVAADRRRLARHTPEPMVGRDSDENDPSTYVPGCPTCQVGVVTPEDFPCDELRDLLAEHDDHPDYAAAWRPAAD